MNVRFGSQATPRHTPSIWMSSRKPMHDGQRHRTSEEKRVTLVGDFESEHDALEAALEQAGKYFK